MFNEVPSLKEIQELHLLQASPSAVLFSQLIVLAKILAQVVFPTPLGPQNKNACASWLFLIAFFNVVVMCPWPITVSKVCGLYFLAETTNLSMNPRPLEGNFETRNIIRYSLIPFLLFHHLPDLKGAKFFFPLSSLFVYFACYSCINHTLNNN